MLLLGLGLEEVGEFFGFLAGVLGGRERKTIDNRILFWEG